MYFELEYIKIEPNEKYRSIIKKALEACYEEERIDPNKLYIEVTLTENEHIRKINKQYRNIDKETDVLSFPMFEKEDFPIEVKSDIEILGDIVISIPKIETQSLEYGNTFERELSYMVIHSFYHLLGFDHENEEDKREMRKKEEKIIGVLF